MYNNYDVDISVYGIRCRLVRRQQNASFLCATISSRIKQNAKFATSSSLPYLRCVIGLSFFVSPSLGGGHYCLNHAGHTNQGLYPPLPEVFYCSIYTASWEYWITNHREGPAQHVPAVTTETVEWCAPAVLRLAWCETFSHHVDPSEQARFFIVSSFSLLQANSVSKFFEQILARSKFDFR
jgi:hypothetical protein